MEFESLNQRLMSQMNILVMFFNENFKIAALFQAEEEYIY